jgi:CheY-like chemotaxis protein
MSIRAKCFLIAALIITLCAFERDAPQALGMITPRPPGSAEAAGPHRRSKNEGGAFGPALALLMAGTIIGVCAAASRSVSGQKLRNTQDASLTDPAGAKWALLANMGDEMRGQADEIIRLCEASMKSEDTIGCDGNIKTIHNAGVMLSGLINDICDTARAETENLSSAQEDYEIQNLINDVISLNMMRIGRGVARLSFRIDESFPRKLRGDALKVKHIFNSMLSCAFRCARGGTVSWELSRETSRMDGGAVWIVSRVSCDGGPPDDGLALGMSAARRVTEMMRGSFTVGGGQRAPREFTARFRQRAASGGIIGHYTAMKLCAMNRDGCRDAYGKTPRETLSYACVLLADSMESSLERTKGILKPYGVRVDCVDSGQAAVELIMAEDVKYDAILIDHLMPGMNGFKTARDIRDIGTEYARNIPLIALSPDSVPDGEAMFLPMDFQAFVEKPVDVILLNSLISRWTRGGSEVPRAIPTHSIFARDAAEGEYSNAGSIMA